MTNTNKQKKPCQGYVLAFGELFLKSPKVKNLLIRKLINNLKSFLKKEKIDFEILNFRTRLFVKTKNQTKVITVLKRIFGLVWFSPAYFFSNAELKDICAFVKKNYSKWIKPSQSFALRLKKDTKEKTEEIIDSIAKEIKRKVNLDKPQKEIFIEKRKTGWFLYLKKQKGPGGLPLGSQGKVLSLISGGIDSPVASWLIAKRGAENIWLHFHSFPLVSQKSIEKIKELAKIFLNFQPKLKIYFIPFADIQTKIKNNIEAKYRILFYRRTMFKIAEALAQKEKCYALVTGESLGQVSSQTLPNIEIIEEAVKIPVLRPLISWDKQEIMDLAKKIKTYHISIQPHEDCCSLFVPKHASAAGQLAPIKKLEKSLNLTPFIKKAISQTKTETFN